MFFGGSGHTGEDYFIGFSGVHVDDKDEHSEDDDGRSASASHSTSISAQNVDGRQHGGEDNMGIKVDQAGSTSLGPGLTTYGTSGDGLGSTNGAFPSEALYAVSDLCASASDSSSESETESSEDSSSASNNSYSSVGFPGSMQDPPQSTTPRHNASQPPESVPLGSTPLLQTNIDFTPAGVRGKGQDLPRSPAFRQAMKPTEEMRTLRRLHLRKEGGQPTLPLSFASPTITSVSSSALDFAVPGDRSSTPSSRSWSFSMGDTTDAAPLALPRAPEASAAMTPSHSVTPEPAATVDGVAVVERARHTPTTRASQHRDDGPPLSASLAARLGSASDIWEAAAMHDADATVSPTHRSQTFHTLSPSQAANASQHKQTLKSPATMPVLPHSSAKRVEASSRPDDDSPTRGASQSRSATAPDVTRTVMRASSMSRRSSGPAAVGHSHSRPNSAGRRNSGVRFIKARKAPDPFAATTGGSVLSIKTGANNFSGSDAADRSADSVFPVLPRSPLAPLLAPTMRDAFSVAIPSDGVVKPSRLTFRDRITTQEEFQSARAQQLVEAGCSSTRPQASSSAFEGSHDSFSSLRSLNSGRKNCDGDNDDDDEVWCANVPAPAPLTLPRRRTKKGVQSSSANTSTETAQPGAGNSKQDAAGELVNPGDRTTTIVSGEASSSVFSFSSSEAPPLLALPARAALDTAHGSSAVGPVPAQWKTTAGEAGKERVVYAGECILPQVLRDHRARQLQASLSQADGTAGTRLLLDPPRATARGEVAIIGRRPSPLRGVSADRVAVEHWSPIAPSLTSRRPHSKAATTSAVSASWSTHTTSSTSASSTSASVAEIVIAMPSAPNMRRAATGMAHVFSLSSSLATGETDPTQGVPPGLHTASLPHGAQDTDRAAEAVASSGTPVQSPLPVAPPSSTSRESGSHSSQRWGDVPLPALSLPTRASYVRDGVGRKPRS